MLRLLAEFRAAPPVQVGTLTGELLRLPFRGFVGSPSPKAWYLKLYTLLLDGPMRVRDLCDVLQCKRSDVTKAAHDINQALGLGFMEDPETLFLSMHFTPLPTTKPSLDRRCPESN